MPPKGRKKLNRTQSPTGFDRKTRSCRDAQRNSLPSPKIEVKSSPLSQLSSGESPVDHKPFEWQEDSSINSFFKVPREPVGRSAMDPQVSLTRINATSGKRALRSNSLTKFVGCVSIPVDRGSNMPLLDDDEYVSQICSPVKNAQTRSSLLAAQQSKLVTSDEDKLSKNEITEINSCGMRSVVLETIPQMEDTRSDDTFHLDPTNGILTLLNTEPLESEPVPSISVDSSPLADAVTTNPSSNLVTDIESATTLSSNDIFDFVENDNYIQSFFQPRVPNSSPNKVVYHPNKLLMPILHMNNIPPISPIIDPVSLRPHPAPLPSGLQPVPNVEVNTPHRSSPERIPVYQDLANVPAHHYSNGVDLANIVYQILPDADFIPSNTFDASTNAPSTAVDSETPGEEDLLQQAIRATFSNLEQTEDAANGNCSSALDEDNSIAAPHGDLACRHDLSESDKETIRRKYNITESPQVSLTICKFENGQWRLLNAPLSNRRESRLSRERAKKHGGSTRGVGRPLKHKLNGAHHEHHRKRKRRKAEKRNKEKLILKIKRTPGYTSARDDSWHIDRASSSFGTTLLPQMDDDISIPSDIEDKAYQMAFEIVGDGINDSVSRPTLMSATPAFNHHSSRSARPFSKPINQMAYSQSFQTLLTEPNVSSTSTPLTRKPHTRIAALDIDYIVREPNGILPLQRRYKGDNGVLDLSKKTGRNFRPPYYGNDKDDMSGVIDLSTPRLTKQTARRESSIHMPEPPILVRRTSLSTLNTSLNRDEDRDKRSDNVVKSPAGPINHTPISEPPVLIRQTSLSTLNMSLNRDEEKTKRSDSVVKVPEEPIVKNSENTQVSVPDKTLIEVPDNSLATNANESLVSTHSLSVVTSPMDMDVEEDFVKSTESELFRKSLFNFDTDFDYDTPDSPEPPVDVEPQHAAQVAVAPPPSLEQPIPSVVDEIRTNCVQTSDTVIPPVVVHPPIPDISHQSVSNLDPIVRPIEMQPSEIKNQSPKESIGSSVDVRKIPTTNKSRKKSLLNKVSVEVPPILKKPGTRNHSAVTFSATSTVIKHSDPDQRPGMDPNNDSAMQIPLTHRIELPESEHADDDTNMPVLAPKKRELKIKLKVKSSTENARYSPDQRTIAVRPSNDTPVGPSDSKRLYERGPISEFNVDSLLCVKRFIHMEGDGSDNEDAISLFAPSIRSPSPRPFDEFIRPNERPNINLNTNPLQSTLPDLRLRLTQQTPRRMSTCPQDSSQALTKSYKIPRRHNSCYEPNAQIPVDSMAQNALAPPGHPGNQPPLPRPQKIVVTHPVCPPILPNQGFHPITPSAGFIQTAPRPPTAIGINISGNVNAFFGFPCFRYLRGCCKETKCPYKHTLPDAQVVYSKLQSVTVDFAEAAYNRLVAKNRIPIEKYFETFCQYFGANQRHEKLVAMMHDSESFSPPYIHFYRHVMDGLVKCGLLPATALKLMMGSLKLYTPDAINEMIELMIPIGLTEFTDDLNGMCTIPNFQFLPQHINAMVDLALSSKYPPLVQVLFRALKMRPDAFGAISVDRSSQFLQLLNEFSGHAVNGIDYQ